MVEHCTPVRDRASVDAANLDLKKYSSSMHVGFASACTTECIPRLVLSLIDLIIPDDNKILHDQPKEISIIEDLWEIILLISRNYHPAQGQMIRAGCEIHWDSLCNKFPSMTVFYMSLIFEKPSLIMSNDKFFRTSV
jgi:hypothetical protein